MTPQISLIIPAIRPKLYQGMYDSLLKTWHGTGELIIVSPYELPNMKLNPRVSVRLIKDFGCPSRALQLGAIVAQADLLSFFTDDCIFDSDTMNKAYRTYQKANNYKTVVVCKYTESDHYSKWMLTPWYYHAWYHADFHHFNIPFHFKLFMNGLLSKKVFMEVGGFDCKYESMAYTYNDLSMRLQFYGCNFVIEKDRLDHCSWQDGGSSDHGPVARACIEHDMPLFRGVYWAKHFEPQIKIDINNWKHSAARWPRRFPQ